MPLPPRDETADVPAGEPEPLVTPATGPDAPTGTAQSPPAQHTAARERTRTSVAFNSLLAGAIVLILLLVFILENTQSVKISYFGAGGHISLGIALLLAAVGGALLVGLAGWARVLQLRHRMKHPKI